MNRAGDSFKKFAPWLTAFLLASFGAQLWVAWLYGSTVPIWDQWDQSLSVFKPWREGRLTFAALANPSSDHRAFLTHFTDIMFISLNGRWDPLVEMVVNACIHLSFAGGLAFSLWHFFGRRNAWLVIFLLLPFFTLPFAGENTIWGYNSMWYFVNVFGLAAIVGLGFFRAGSWQWWCGFTAAILGLLTMALGPIALMATGGLIVLRGIKSRRINRENAVSFGVCVLLVCGGWAMGVRAEGYRPLQAHSAAEFVSALIRHLDWPFFNAPVMACVILLPLVWLLVCYLRPNFHAPAAAELVLALALWSVLQSALLAFGRANYGEGIPACRYMVVFSVLLIASLFAAALLGEHWQRGRFPKLNPRLVPVVFSVLLFFGVVQMARIVVDNLLLPTRTMNLIAEERIAKFAADGDEKAFLEPPRVRPNPEEILTILKDPALKMILPASCLPPSSVRAAGPLTIASQWLMRHSIGILATGLILFIGLCGIGLVRGSMDLTAKKPEGIIGLLAGLVALSFVIANHSLHRDTVECQLQQQLAGYFKSAGNLDRAAIHERKAGELNAAK